MRAARSGYTLLEVLLAMSMAVLVLAAVYSFVGYQLRQAQAGREIIERVTLARALCNRFSADIHGALAQNDPARFRRNSGDAAATADASQQTGGASTGGASTGGTSGTTGSSGTTSTSGTAGASSATGSATDTSSSSGSGASGESQVDMPLGVVGSSTELHLFVSRVPLEVYGSGDQGGLLTCDQRRISYWLGGEGAGLCRLEARLITGEEATTPDLPSGDVAAYVLAPEVQSLEFSYFDGSSWADSWDSTAPGADGTTPIGSPRAIAVRVGVASNGRTGSDELKYYRHVVAVPTANGTPQTTPTPEAGTSP